MDKKLFVHLQGGRKVSGTLRGYDLFLNLVIDDAVEETTPGQKHPIGTVVWLYFSLFVQIRFPHLSLRSSGETASHRWRHWKPYALDICRLF